MRFEEELLVYSQCLYCGIISKKDLLNYIDNQIIKLDNPPEISIDIAFISTKKIEDIYKVLEDFFIKEEISFYDFNFDILKVLRYKYINNKISLKECMMYLDRLGTTFYLPDAPDKLYFLFEIDYLDEEELEYFNFEELREELESVLLLGEESSIDLSVLIN